MLPNDIDAFCTNCQHFDRIMKGKAMAGWCNVHNVIVDGRKQFFREILPPFSEDLGRLVETRAKRFKLEKDCWEDRQQDGGTATRRAHNPEIGSATLPSAKKSRINFGVTGEGMSYSSLYLARLVDKPIYFDPCETKCVKCGHELDFHIPTGNKRVCIKSEMVDDGPCGCTVLVCGCAKSKKRVR